MERQEKIQIGILVLIAIFIIVMITVIIILVKNIDEIKSDPVQYSIDKEFYDSCSCFKAGLGQRNFGNQMVIQNWTS